MKAYETAKPIKSGADLTEIHCNSKLLQSVIDDLESREQRGIAKYNTTMDRSDLTHKEWLQHAYEEALDMALYLKKAINESKSK
jgi:hypothetical protein